MTTIFTIIGVAALLWWVAGVIMLASMSTFYVFPGTPLGVKLKTIWLSGWTLPWALIVNHSLPVMGVLMPSEPTPEQQAEFDAWREAHCPCPRCKARRGE